MDLAEIRTELDAVDSELLALFVRRMDLIDKVADAKRRDPSRPLYDPVRERAILMKVRENAGSHGDAAHQLFRMILELSRAQQAAQLIPATSVAARVAAMCSHEQAVFPQSGRIAVSGVEGSHAGSAADRLFPKGDIMFVDGFRAVVQAVQAGLCQFGILPIENSVNGSVRQVFDLLREPDLCIVRSVRLLIRHVLLTQKDARISDIKTIYTHEQAAGQCSKFISSLEGVDVIPCTSTAHAAQRAAEAHDKSVAAIAGEACAKLYGLSVLTDAIQNESNNDTRFLCIAKGAQCFAGAERMSILVNCANSPGALYQMIAKISALGINMCKLESMPIPGTNFSYRFFMDLECNLHQDGVLGLLCEMERTCDSFTLLGNYSEMIG
ncbi:MAG: chorismate mutase [Oscillospiraceae bacterium]|nr:chorismate mutase [Oscillospiraceae bacterium]